MKKKKNKLTNFLKFGILLIGISLLLWNCEREELIPIEEQESLQQERTSKSITFEALENTPVYKHFNQKLQLDLKTDKQLKYLEKGAEITNNITIITQKVNQVINNGVETFSMFVKYKEQQENTYYNLVLYKKRNTYRIYTLKIETSKKLHGKGTSVGMETEVTAQGGMVPPDGWEEEDTVDDGGIGYEWQCWSVTLQVPYSCGSGGHYPNGSGAYPQGCTGSPTVPYWPGYNYITDSDCGYVYVGTSSNSVDDGSNSGNTSGGGTTPDTENPIDVDAVNPIDLIPEGADPIEWFEEKIDDSNLKPCMKTILNDLKSTTNGIGYIITKFAGNDPGFNWEVKDGSLIGGTGQTSNSYNRSTGTVTTTFDSQAWRDATNLSWARTILHESVHAYIVAFTRTDPIASKITFAELLKDHITGKYPTLNLTQHAEIVRNYVNDIATSLKEYGINKGYSLSNQFYEDFAWGGLTQWRKRDSSGNFINDSSGNPIFENSSWFTNTYPNSNDRDRVMNTILIELTKKDIYGNTKTQKGTNAGC